MAPPSPAKILIGVPLDEYDSQELLSWAVRVLASANDTIVALHVIETKDAKKHVLKTKDYRRFRRAKAFVISVVGEFAKLCHSKQINLEAKVAFSSSIGRGLVEEVNLNSAEFLLVRGTRNRLNRTSSRLTLSYCYEHAPENCAVVSIGKSGKQGDFSNLNSPHSKESLQSSSRESTRSMIANESQKKIEKKSPRTVLDLLDGDSHSTEEEMSSFGDLSSAGSPPQPPRHRESNTRKQQSMLKLFSSFLQSPFDMSGRRRRGGELFDEERHQSLLRCFSYAEISSATNNFNPDNLVGLGGYSEVYRGEVCNGEAIAVKRLAKDNTEKEFLMELGILGHVSHPNTAKLIGCCIENGHHLIFNFCPNGNLATALHGKTCNLLKWPIRYKIAVGVARGLHYLHKCCKHRIIHRDIKASNVLLGPDFEPQITDFGLAKWLPNKWTHHAVIPIEGTFGYLAPEYFMHGIVDEKIDVFSFGILLLEIITGRRPVDSSEQNLLYWAKPLLEAGNVAELADPKLGGKYDMEQMHRLALAATYCVRRSAMWRPPMSEVLELLTTGHDPEAARGWGMPKQTDDEMDDYSMVLESDLSTDITLEDIK